MGSKFGDRGPGKPKCRANARLCHANPPRACRLEEGRQRAHSIEAPEPIARCRFPVRGMTPAGPGVHCPSQLLLERSRVISVAADIPPGGRVNTVAADPSPGGSGQCCRRRPRLRGVRDDRVAAALPPGGQDDNVAADSLPEGSGGRSHPQLHLRGSWDDRVAAGLPPGGQIDAVTTDSFSGGIGPTRPSPTPPLGESGQ